MDEMGDMMWYFGYAKHPNAEIEEQSISGFYDFGKKVEKSSLDTYCGFREEN